MVNVIQFGHRLFYKTVQDLAYSLYRGGDAYDSVLDENTQKQPKVMLFCMSRDAIAY